MYNLFIQKRRDRNGITLIALIIIIIVLMILSGITIATINSEEDIILKSVMISKETIEDEIKSYMLAIYSQVMTEGDSENNVIDELVYEVVKDNLIKDEEYRYNILETDKVNNTITVRYRAVELEVDLPNREENIVQSSSEEMKNKKYSVIFDYKDINGINKRVIMYIDKNQTIQEYLNISGENLPKNTEWIPNIDFNTPIMSNKIYKEKLNI